MPDTFKCNKYSSQRFRKALEDKEIHCKINLFMERNFKCDEKMLKVHVNYLRNLYIRLLQKSFNTKTSPKMRRKSHKWYDEELCVIKALQALHDAPPMR